MKIISIRAILESVPAPHGVWMPRIGRVSSGLQYFWNALKRAREGKIRLDEGDAGFGAFRPNENSYPLKIPVLALFILLCACTGREPQRPNVLLITLDTFRADRVGALTPNLTALANEGVAFDHAVAPAPLTLPAHATILSGVLPLHHGVRNNGAGSFSGQTVATRLQSSGWRTGAFVAAFVLDHRFGLARGFDVYDDAIIRDPNDDSTSALEAQRRGGEVVDAALTWLKREDGRPFFAWVHLYDAHVPYAPPPPHPQSYDGEIRYVDSQVGRLLAAINRRNTIVVIVGDHGEALGEHGEPTHGLLLYEGTLRVPMIFAAPNLRAYRVTEPVSTADVVPTLAALAGVPMGGTLDGRSLADDLKKQRQPKRVHIYAETQYPVSFGWTALSSLRSGNTKLISGGKPELFDLARDPHETSNVIEDRRRSYREMQSSLEALLKTGTAAGPAAVDDETRAKLASLGYIAPSGSPGTGSGRDPRETLPLFLKFEEAMTRLNANDARRALPLLEEIVAADPANRLFRSTLARAVRSLGDRRRAVALYRESVALAPNDADTWYNLATTLQEAGQLREARIAIDEALRREPNRPEAHNTLGVIHASEGNLAAAAEQFRNALVTDPRNARAYNNLGNVLRGLGHAAEATDAYRHASELAPSYPDPLNGMGVMLVQQGRARDAITYFDAALRLAPAFYEARLNRAIALQIAGDGATARLELTALLAALPPGRTFEEQRRAARAVLGTLRINQ